MISSQIHDDGSSTRVEKPEEPEGKKPDSLNRPPPLPQKVSGNQQLDGGRSTQLEKPGKPKGEKLERLNQPPPLPQKTSGKENVDSDSSDELEPGELREERKDDRVTGPPPLPQQISGGQKYDGSIGIQVHREMVGVGMVVVRGAISMRICQERPERLKLFLACSKRFNLAETSKYRWIKPHVWMKKKKRHLRPEAEEFNSNFEGYKRL
ncbi:hypothetical protein C8R42DRAFT_710159 [Lentinula raphanica]|nr:hypothetical protein C8R42DRAFT_710159 [Lentinula raphanica]